MTPTKERRFWRLSLRVSARERSTIETAASRSGLCLSDYLRRIVLAAKPLRAKRRPPLEAVLAARLLAQLGTITSELRTIARQTAAQLMPIVERDLARSLRELRECRFKLLRALCRKAGAP
jgi:uncharacterized protein (DUF1778 family)